MENEAMISIEKINEHYLRVYIDADSFMVPVHWFWDEFIANWEPQTFHFFRNNLIGGSNYLDIGGWVGPTALLATALGASKTMIVEPNPRNFLNLLLTQKANNFYDKWTLVNACVASSRGFLQIGPIEGIHHASSATNIRNQEQSGVEVLSIKVEDLLGHSDFSLVKIDIEGAEALIVDDLHLFADSEAAIWLSLHPPFIDNKEDFLAKLVNLNDKYFFVDHSNSELHLGTLGLQILSDIEKPAWGTEWGNFFEIGLLPKKYYDNTGMRKP